MFIHVGKELVTVLLLLPFNAHGSISVIFMLVVFSPTLKTEQEICKLDSNFNIQYDMELLFRLTIKPILKVYKLGCTGNGINTENYAKNAEVRIKEENIPLAV